MPDLKIRCSWDSMSLNYNELTLQTPQLLSFHSSFHFIIQDLRDLSEKNSRSQTCNSHLTWAGISVRFSFLWSLSWELSFCLTAAILLQALCKRTGLYWLVNWGLSWRRVKEAEKHKTIQILHTLVFSFTILSITELKSTLCSCYFRKKRKTSREMKTRITHWWGSSILLLISQASKGFLNHYCHLVASKIH